MEYDRDETFSAAKRRRERRLRAAWRHEQLSVRMALAAAQHHSAPKCAGPETHVALRGQTTAKAAGKRPAPLAEVSRPQEAAVTVGHVAAAGAPSLATPSLADAAGDAVDAVTVEFLVEWALLEPEEQERIRMVERRKRERRKTHEEKQNLEEKVGKKKRKKKRKKRLPCAPRPRLVSGCCLRSTQARPLSSSLCLDLEWIQVPASVPEAFWDEFHTVST